MKRLILFLSFSFLLSIASFAQIIPSDLKINIENVPSTFIQKSPVIFPNGSSEYLAVWEDYRDGEKGFYGKSFDSTGYGLGGNIKVSSNFKVCFNKEGGFINSYENYFHYPFFPSTYSLIGNIYNSDHEFVIALNLGGGWLPDCGMGWMGIQHDELSFGNSFYSILKFDHDFNINKFDSFGNHLSSAAFPFDGHFAPMQFSSEINSNGELFVICKAVDVIGHDTIKTFTAVFDSSLTVLSGPNDLGLNSLNQNFYFEPQNNWKTIAVSDTLFQFFEFDIDSLKLKYTRYNTDGFAVTNEQSIQLPQNILIDPEAGIHHLAFSHTPIVEDKFDIIISLKEYANAISNFKYLTVVYTFNKDGEFIGEKFSTEKQPHFGNEVYKNKNEEYVLGVEKDSDVYSVSYKDFAPFDSLLLNEDTEGSNESLPGIIPMNDAEGSYFYYWKEEQGYYGRVFNKSNTPELGDEIIIKNNQLIFFENHPTVNFYLKKDSEGVTSLNLLQLDESFNQINEAVIDSSSRGLRYSFTKNSDTSFVLIYTKLPNLITVQINNRGIVIDTDTIATNFSHHYTANIRKENNSYWVKWSSNIQQFDLQFNPLSEIYSIDFNFIMFLGDSLYLCKKQIDFNDYMYAYIKNFDGEIIKEDFILGPFSIKNIEGKLLNETEYMISYINQNKFYYKVFDKHTGLKIDDKLINEDHDQFVKDGNFIVNENDIIFVWADTRNDQTGYDIYSKSIYKNSVTEVVNYRDLILPDKFILNQNYPNPFNPSTKIEFAIPPGIGKTDVSLKVFDILGTEVKTVIEEEKLPGKYSVTFNGSNLASGIYFYTLRAGNKMITKKMLLLK